MHIKFISRKDRKVKFKKAAKLLIIITAHLTPLILRPLRFFFAASA